MAKTKQCSICKTEVQKLWYSNPPTCPRQSCIAKRNAMKYKKGTNSPEKKKVSKIKPISDRKQKELVVYRKLRDEYMASHKICEWCGEKPSKDLHHKMPRAYYLRDVSVFSALCRSCHDRCESDHNAAREAGFKLDHLGVNKK